MQKYTNIKTEIREAVSEIEITGEITVEAITEYRKKALKQITEALTIDGFRKGHAPEKVVIEKVGEVYILEESAELGLKDIAPELIEKNAPTYVGRPQISITKLAPGNPVGFKIVVGILPKFSLPDYVKLAKKQMSLKDEPTEVSEKEIDDVIGEIKKQRKHEGEFNDEFVKTLGAFESVADFRTKAKENMMKEKEHKNIEKKRGALLEALVTETKLVLPKVIIDSEVERMYGQFEADISGMGLKLEDYLKHIKKTTEELKKDWIPEAEKRAKLNLILAEIATTEKITADKELVELEVKKLKEQFKDVDPLRITAYVQHSLAIENVIKFLESK